MKKILILINTLAFIASIIWLIAKPDYDSLISSLVTLASLIGLVFIKKDKNKSKPSLKMTQKSGKNSTQYQSGRDMTINL